MSLVSAFCRSRYLAGPTAYILFQTQDASELVPHSVLRSLVRKLSQTPFADLAVFLPDWAAEE